MNNNWDLTDREFEVLKLLTQGKSNEEIAEILIIEVCTVKAHITSVFKKLGVKTRLQAVVKAFNEG